MKRIPQDLPTNCEFIFQNEFGFVFRVDPKIAEKLRTRTALISGSIKKIKTLESKRTKSEPENEFLG